LDPWIRLVSSLGPGTVFIITEIGAVQGGQVDNIEIQINMIGRMIQIMRQLMLWIVVVELTMRVTPVGFGFVPLLVALVSGCSD